MPDAMPVPDPVDAVPVEVPLPIAGESKVDPPPAPEPVPFEAPPPLFVALEPQPSAATPPAKRTDTKRRFLMARLHSNHEARPRGRKGPENT
jgi:hypothetical protein